MSTISFDFDGVLHPYTRGWIGYEPDDEPPAEGLREFLHTLHDAGYRLVISSCRADCKDGLQGIRNWLREHNLHHYFAQVSCEKPAAVAYIDDRAVPFGPGVTWSELRASIDRLAKPAL